MISLIISKSGVFLDFHGCTYMMVLMVLYGFTWLCMVVRTGSSKHNGIVVVEVKGGSKLSKFNILIKYSPPGCFERY